MLVIGFTTSCLRREAIFDHQTCDRRTIRVIAEVLCRVFSKVQASTPGLAESAP
jgi:hypothetical protein